MSLLSVYVKSRGQGRTPLLFLASTTISDVKRGLQRRFNCPASHICLLFDGKTLQNAKTLKESGLYKFYIISYFFIL